MEGMLATLHIQACRCDLLVYDSDLYAKNSTLVPAYGACLSAAQVILGHNKMGGMLAAFSNALVSATCLYMTLTYLQDLWTWLVLASVLATAT